MVGYRVLFGVPDETTDVTRVSGMVPKRRLIYRMTSFDYRKVFGVTGNVPGMTNGFREVTGGRGQPTPGKPIGLKGGAPALSGLVGQPKRALCAKKRKSREKKGGGGKEGGLPPTKPSPTRFGGSPPPLGSADPLRVPWTPRQGSPPSSYIYGAFRADLRRLSHGCPTTYLHSFSSRSRFCGARAEPC